MLWGLSPNSTGNSKGIWANYFNLYPLENYQKTYGFLIISGGMKANYLINCLVLINWWSWCRNWEKKNKFIMRQKFSNIYCIHCLFTPEAPLVQSVRNFLRLMFAATDDNYILYYCHIYDTSHISVTVQLKPFIEKSLSMKKSISITSWLFFIVHLFSFSINLWFEI